MPNGETHPLTVRVLQNLAYERKFQDCRWQRSPGVWPGGDGQKLAVLMEEVGEVARALLEHEPLTALRNEIVQVAAVAVAWAEVLTVDIDKSTAARVVTSAGVVATGSEAPHV